MEVTLNGDSKIVSGEMSVLSLLRNLAGINDAAGIAVAVNGAVIPKSDWERILLRPGMKIEIVRAVAGG